ncbi:MAG: metallophosphoesterase family protein [Ardenticatenales bacterium]
MRTIVHLSDLHFGRIDPPILGPLARAVAAIQPDVVAISGDLTQRARVSQFEEARAFLDRLPRPQIVVPGNHDIPLHNLFLRFKGPLKRFRQYITADPHPMYVDDEIAVIGVNTARSLVAKGGRLNRVQVGHICEQFGRLGPEHVRIVVTHHPFDVPDGWGERNLVGRARMAVEAFAECGVDLFLAGHLHLNHFGSTARYDIEGHSALVIQAGTASSTRGRGEPNSFNVLEVDSGRIRVNTHSWHRERGAFGVSDTRAFQRVESGWG